TENPQAYRLYLQGRRNALLANKEGFDRALEQFGKALEIDPNYALALAGMAEAYWSNADLLGVSAKEAAAKGKTYATEALARDDTLSEAYCALALILSSYDWDWPRAERDFEKALQLDPNSSCHENYGVALASIGRFNEAFQHLKRAVDLDPRSNS